MDRAERGRAAEAAVVEYLQTAGYEIVARNLRLGRLEIDVVARREDVVAIVEVRARGAGAWTTGFGSMDAAKRSRIRRAGERLWRERYVRDASVRHLRFDAASVQWGEGGEAKVEYATAAF